MTAAPVLFVTGTLEVGGSETKIVKIANALARCEYTVSIAYFNPPDTLLDRIDQRVAVTHLERRGKFSVASLRRLGRIAADQIVVSVNFYPLLYVVPVVKFFRRSKGRAVCLINTTEFVDSQWIWGPLYAPFLRRCDELVYGCKAQQALWTRKYRLPANRSRYIYNGVDSDRFSPYPDERTASEFRAQHGIPEDAVVVGGIGRFAPEKNFELLIEAFARLVSTGRSAYLVLVGEGAEKPKLAAAAAGAGVSGLTVFPGVQDDVRAAISAMDVFVLPSRAVETFSNAALEAMAMARPVVLSNIGGASEMIDHGQTGYLFDVGDRDALTGILTELHDSSSLRERIGRAARQRVVENFSFETMVAGYRAIIDSLS